jgi:hypothetical protein
VKGIKRLALASGLTVYLAATAAFAAMPLPFGWYIEGNLGESYATSKSYPTPSTLKKNGFGGNINGGYKFNPFFAGEIGVTDYAETRINNAAGELAAKDQHYSYDITSKIMLPVGTSGVELFGKIGAARSNSDVTVYQAASLNNLVFNNGSHYSTNFYFGAGVDYAILTHLVANLQWAQAQGSNMVGNSNLYSAGLSWIL